MSFDSACDLLRSWKIRLNSKHLSLICFPELLWVPVLPRIVCFWEGRWRLCVRLLTSRPEDFGLPVWERTLQEQWCLVPQWLGRLRTVNDMSYNACTRISLPKRKNGSDGKLHSFLSLFLNCVSLVSNENVGKWGFLLLYKHLWTGPSIRVKYTSRMLLTEAILIAVRPFW